MPPEEIRELLELKDWTIEQLAVALECSRFAIDKWLSGKRPGAAGPAKVLMREWLLRARAEAGKTNGRKMVKA